MLAVEHLGTHDGSVAKLVVVHGFTQNARCWGEFGVELSTHWPVLAVDAPGHGNSGHESADLDEAGRLMIDTGRRSHYLGYSMGGRMLLHAALGANRDSIESLVLIGATAGIDDQTTRTERRRLDEERSSRLLSVGTEVFVDEWLSSPLFAGLTEEQTCRRQRLTNRSAGLATSLRNCGTGNQTPLWDRLAVIEFPVLVMAGSGDEKFTALGHRLVECIGASASFVEIEGGHAAHLENPRAASDAIVEWRTQVC